MGGIKEALRQVGSILTFIAVMAILAFNLSHMGEAKLEESPTPCEAVVQFRDPSGRLLLVRTLDVASLLTDKGSSLLVLTNGAVIEAQDGDDLSGRLTQALRSCGVHVSLSANLPSAQGGGQPERTPK